MLEEYDIIDKNPRGVTREKRLTRTEQFKKRYEKKSETNEKREINSEVVELEPHELDAVRNLKECPFCHKTNTDILFKFCVNRPHKRYTLNHHCSALRCTIETEHFVDLNELVRRWNGEYIAPDKRLKET